MTVHTVNSRGQLRLRLWSRSFKACTQKFIHCSALCCDMCYHIIIGGWKTFNAWKDRKRNQSDAPPWYWVTMPALWREINPPLQNSVCQSDCLHILFSQYRWGLICVLCSTQVKWNSYPHRHHFYYHYLCWRWLKMDVTTLRTDMWINQGQFSAVVSALSSHLSAYCDIHFPSHHPWSFTKAYNTHTRFDQLTTHTHSTWLLCPPLTPDC